MKRLLLSAIVLMGAAPALGQARVDPGLDLLRERQKADNLRRLETAPRSANVDVGPEPVGASAVCFPIASIVVDGVTALPGGAADAVTQARRGTCMGQREIERLIHDLRKTYADRGLITAQVYVPAQDLKSGTLRLVAVEGRIERLVHARQWEGEKAVEAPWISTQAAFPGVEGGVLQLRDLEQGVAQINRQPSSSAAIDILPGSEPGASVVAVLEKKKRSWRVTAGADGNGQSATGRLRLRAGLEWDGPLGLGDMWSMTFAGARSSNALAMTTSIPWGWWTISHSLSLSQQGTVVSTISDLVTSSAAETVQIERVLHRDADSLIKIAQSANWYWNDRWINSTALQSQFLGWLRTGATLERYFDDARWSLEGGISFGVPELARTDDVPGLALDAARARFTKLDASLTHLRALPEGWSLLATATAQYSSLPLYSPNQISVGGWDSVRGFRDSSIAGDTGFYVRTELSRGISLPWAVATKTPGSTRVERPVPASGDGLLPSFDTVGRTLSETLTPYGFADGGMVHSNAGGKTTSLASVGLGLRSNADRVGFDVAVALPVLRPEGRAHGVEATASLNIKLW